MKSIEVIVSIKLIEKFYPHPEPYGEDAFVVDLINGMHTDVFKKPNGEFITITNDEELIKFLTENKL